MQSVRRAFGSAVVLAILAGCGSVQRVEFPPGASADRERSRLEGDMSRAREGQVDLLDIRDFRTAEDYAARAGRTNSLTDIGYARAYLKRAQIEYHMRAPAMESVLKAREAAVEAGAEMYDSSAKDLLALDHQVYAMGRRLDRNADLRDQTVSNYAAIKAKAIQETYLSGARAVVNHAVAQGAIQHAPKSLMEAQLALNMAKVAIATRPNDRKAFAPDVKRARRAARQLAMVNRNSLRGSNMGREKLARELLAKEKQIAQLRQDLRATELEAALKTNALQENGRELMRVSAQLKTEDQFNRAISETRQKFASEEAEVYREGNKLLIQLKQLDFKPGSAEVPDNSKALLAKVKTVIDELHPTNVLVEGHTDATGSSEINKSVSEKRASVVAEFIGSETGFKDVEAVGYGENYPIRTNSTAHGRSVNRRVDVVIKPSLIE